MSQQDEELPAVLLESVQFLDRMRPYFRTAGEVNVLIVAIFKEFSDRNLAAVLSRHLGISEEAAIMRAIAARDVHEGSREVRLAQEFLESQGWRFGEDV